MDLADVLFKDMNVEAEISAAIESSLASVMSKMNYDAMDDKAKKVVKKALVEKVVKVAKSIK